MQNISTSNATFFVLNTFENVFYFISFVVCLIGIFTSFITFLIFFNKSKKQSTDVFSSALSALDLLCNISGFLFTLSSLSSWGYSQGVCWATIYLWRMAPTASWLLVLSIASTRYFAVFRYNCFRRRFNRKIVAYILIVVMSAAILLSVPFPFSCCQVHDVTTDQLNGAKRPHEGDYTYKIFRFHNQKMGEKEIYIYIAAYRIVLVLSVMTAIWIMYARVIRELHNRRRHSQQLRIQLRKYSQDGMYGSSSSSEPDTEMQLEGIRVFFVNTSQRIRVHFRHTFAADEDGNIQNEVMFINIAALFTIANLPYAIIETLDILQPQLNPHPRATSAMLVLFVWGFNVNPCIFYVSNPWFRERCADLYYHLYTRIRGSWYEQL